MLVKASILASAVLAVTVILTSVDFRELYNEMYPVNGLKRDVLTVCRQAKPSFIRAIKADREDCYDSMPDSVELAIGWIRTSSMLAEIAKPTPVEAAEKALVQALKTGSLGVVPQFTGFVAPAPAPVRPCPELAKALAPMGLPTNPKSGKPGDRLAKRITGNDDAALAALGLRNAKAGGKIGTASRAQDLPVLPLNGNTVPATASSADCKTAA